MSSRACYIVQIGRRSTETPLLLGGNAGRFLCIQYPQAVQRPGYWVIETHGKSVTLGRLSLYSGPQCPHLKKKVSVLLGKVRVTQVSTDHRVSYRNTSVPAGKPGIAGPVTRARTMGQLRKVIQEQDHFLELIFNLNRFCFRNKYLPELLLTVI